MLAERGYTSVLVVSSKSKEIKTEKKEEDLFWWTFIFLKSGPVQTPRPPPGKGRCVESLVGEAGAPATIPATVRILRGSGPVQTLNVNIEVGRKFFRFMQADDQAASVQLNPPSGFRPHVSAMVEYTTP
jgi:hypothetical protein